MTTTVREYRESDLEALVEMYHRQGFDYEFPALHDPAFFSRQVLVREGRPRMALFGRATCEMYFLLDPADGDPQTRWHDFRRLHRASETDVLNKGLLDAHCWLPPVRAMRPFQRRLKSLGWIRDDKWTPFVKYLKEEQPWAEEAHQAQDSEGARASVSLAPAAANHQQDQPIPGPTAALPADPPCLSSARA